MVETHLVDTLQVRTQPTVNTEHTTIHNRSQSQIIENFAAPPPNV